MTKEELEKEAEELYEDWYAHKLGAISIIGVICKMAEPREKRITELEEKISVLLSCKNCSENKGGYICEKEYENKCLTQKMQYIKELQEENAELDCQRNRNKFCYSCANATERCFRNEIGCPCEKYKSYKDENAELKDEWQEQVQKENDESYARTLQTMQLTKAKKIIKTLADDLSMYSGNYQKELLEAKQFLNSEVDK